jgi:hypothetical protein
MAAGAATHLKVPNVEPVGGITTRFKTEAITI